ncbi:MAG TPA: malto-oligosyltrehalose trehalohydrolase [Dyella sp.]|uniref:malto-oligosyltrehalose trehalohydrolase n=1 Tax=Dyella sp. TaxID=1869338 RepID=UPI002F9506E6
MSRRIDRRRYGAQPMGDGDTLFRLWAPDANKIAVVTDDAAYPMQALGDGDWEATAPLAAGTRYRYEIDNQRVPDPASCAQTGDIDGASIVVDPDAYRWRHDAWRGRSWEEAIVCELHVGLLGGFDGVRAALPALLDAGYTAIQLMPVAEFPGARNWGYDGVLPYAPDASYGSVEALKALIDDAHGLGLMVLLDVVYNHFGPYGNYLATYAEDFFRSDTPTPWGPAIDFRRRQVRRFFIDNALMWLNDYRFDGLRLDAVHAIRPRGFLERLADAIRRGVDPERRIHLILENEHNDARLLRDDYVAQWNDDGHNALHVLLTGETEGYYADYAGDPTAALQRVLAEGFAFQGQRDRRGVRRGQPSAHLPPTSFVFFMQNHDQVGNRPLGDRLASLLPLPRWKVATALVALCPMIPLFFMGDEWACDTPFFYFTSHPGELAAQVREGRRREFAHFAGFSHPAQRERIPDPNAAATFDASRPRGSDTALALATRTWFGALLGVRKQHLIPHLRGTRAVACARLGKSALRAQWQLADGRLWTLGFNVGADAVACMAPAGAQLLHVEAPEAESRPFDGDLPPNSLAAWIGGAE